MERTTEAPMSMRRTNLGHDLFNSVNQNFRNLEQEDNNTHREVGSAVPVGVIGVDLESKFSGIGQKHGDNGLGVILHSPHEDAILEGLLGQEAAFEATHDAGKGSIDSLWQGKADLRDTALGTHR